jgi:hypothetical protein
MATPNFLSFAISLALGSTLAFAGPIVIPPASPNCGAGASIGNLSGGSCPVGNFSYFNFGLTVAASVSNGSAVATASDIEVVLPAVAGGSLQFISNKFDVKAGDRVRYFISYTIDPPPPILPGFDLDLFTETPVAPGQATITANICVGGIFTFGCTDVGAPNFQGLKTLEVFHLGLPVGPGDVKLKDFIAFAAPVNLIDVRIEIDLDARDGGSSQIRGIGTGTQVPEPGTWAMMGGGLAMLAFLRRRK